MAGEGWGGESGQDGLVSVVVVDERWDGCVGGPTSIVIDWHHTLAIVFKGLARGGGGGGLLLLVVG